MLTAAFFVLWWLDEAPWYMFLLMYPCCLAGKVLNSLVDGFWKGATGK